MAEDYDGGCCPEQDLREMYLGLAEWMAADWRQERFGIHVHQNLHALIDRAFSPYLNGHGSNPYFPQDRERLPPGSDACWAHGTWVPVTWHDRRTELVLECQAAREREQKKGG